MYDDDDEDDSLTDDREAPDPSDMIDEPATVPCPYCKHVLQEDAERCHACGAYISREDAPQARPWTWVVAMVLLIVIVLTWLWKF